MHNAALAASGLNDWCYEAMPVEPSRLAEAVRTLRSGEFGGANVTVPHKEAVIPLLDGLTPLAETIGAVNTIIKRDGRLIGHNTDAAGLLADLRAHGVRVEGREVLILGAGGAARAAAGACAEMGAGVRVAARRRAQAESLKEIAPGMQVFDLTRRDLARAAEGCELIINATPLGMWPQVDSSPWFEDAAFPAGAFVYDLVYNPAETKLARQARAAGLRAATGLGMLIEQGALAFEWWTGRAAPREIMRNAISNL